MPFSLLTPPTPSETMKSGFCVFWFLFYGHTRGIWKILGQQSNPSCTCKLCRSCSNTGFSTHRAASATIRIPNPRRHSGNSLNCPLAVSSPRAGEGTLSLPDLIAPSRKASYRTGQALAADIAGHVRRAWSLRATPLPTLLLPPRPLLGNVPADIYVRPKSMPREGQQGCEALEAVA